MSTPSSSLRRWRVAGALAATATVLAACGGGSSDVVGGDGQSAADTTLTLVAYAVPEPGWSKIIPAFAATPEGKGVAVTTSYGASGDQSRAVVDGKPADIVNFSVEPDVSRLVKANKVASDWNKDVTKGIRSARWSPWWSARATRRTSGTGTTCCSPASRWSPQPVEFGFGEVEPVGPYAATSNGGQNQQAGLDFVTKLVNEHVKTRPGSGREATDVFLQGSGDVLISYENEAINIERQGKPVEHINPRRPSRSRTRSRW